MPTKCKLRQIAEDVLTHNCVRYGSVFVDKSKSGQRIKFSHVIPSDIVVADIRRDIKAEYPKNDTRVWYVEPSHSYGVGGLAVKVFNN